MRKIAVSGYYTQLSHQERTMKMPPKNKRFKRYEKGIIQENEGWFNEKKFSRKDVIGFILLSPILIFILGISFIYRWLTGRKKYGKVINTQKKSLRTQKEVN